MTPCGATGSASSACQHDDRTGGRNPYFQMQAPLRLARRTAQVIASAGQRGQRAFRWLKTRHGVLRLCHRDRMATTPCQAVAGLVLLARTS